MTKKSSRAGVRKPKPSTGSTAAGRRVSRKTKSARRTSKPKTAYELLERVCRHILEEPRRYFQSTWIDRNEKRIKAAMGSAPHCGTMACRAGWIVALHDGVNAKALRGSQCSYPPPAMARANEILYMSEWDTSELFDADALVDLGDGHVPKPGTAAYARLGVKGLRAFMADHEADLKARKLADVPKEGSHV